MFGIVKPVMRVAVIAGLGLGAAAVVAGPHRVAGLFHSAQQKVCHVIDANVDDPTVLRSQLRELAEKYPQRIAGVRGDLAELQEQMRQIERDKQVSERVVALATNDFDSLKVMLAKGEDARATAGAGRAILVSFNDKTMKLEEAYSRATQIQQTRAAYQNKAADADRTLSYLEQQETRMTELLGKLEAEQAEFQTQLWQIDHQVDAIARNDRLLEMLEKRQKQIDSYSRYDVVSLDQVKQRLSQVQAKQESQFASLDKTSQRLNYEDKAAAEIESERAARHEFERSTETLERTGPSPAIHITPESVSPSTPPADAGPVATRDPFRAGR